jgi:hypothetical protein
MQSSRCGTYPLLQPADVPPLRFAVQLLRQLLTLCRCSAGNLDVGRPSNAQQNRKSWCAVFAGVVIFWRKPETTYLRLSSSPQPSELATVRGAIREVFSTRLNKK